MKSYLFKWDEESNEWDNIEKDFNCQNPDFVLCFISPKFKKDHSLIERAQSLFDKTQIISLSTGGEIFQNDSYEDSAFMVAVKFKNIKVKCSLKKITDFAKSKETGQELVKDLISDDLSAIMVFSDGLNANGTDLLKGMYEVLPANIPVTGGLAGDADKFEETRVGLNEFWETGNIVALAFYGNDLIFGYGSSGGWKHFGPQRKITRAEGNILYELDGKPALELYKKYLTPEQIEKLPSSGLLFPLSLQKDESSNDEVVRTIVGVDEENQSLIFAGDIQQGYTARLMMGSFDNLLDGASRASELATEKVSSDNEKLAIHVSCIGRRLLMGQQISDEPNAVSLYLPDNVKRIGFYSYGEICPHQNTGQPTLHNQTMTVTIIGEKDCA